MSRGLLGFGKRVTLEALSRAQGHDLARCRALFAAGQFGCFMGQYDEARVLLEESSAIAREGDESLLASITSTLALTALGQGDQGAARNYFEEAIERSRESRNRREFAVSLNGLTQLDRMEGALDAADAHYQQALLAMRESGDREGSAVMLLNLAIVAIGRGAGTRARDILQDVLAISVEMQSKPTGQCALDVCAALAALCGEWRRAARFFGAVEAQTEQTGYHRDPSDEALLAPLIAQARARLGAQTFDGADTEGRPMSYDEAIEEARGWLSSLMIECGE